VAAAPFFTQVTVLAGIAVLMTIGVYGLVAGIVKLDDAGFYLSRQSSAIARSLGAGIVRAAPYLMKGLSVAGTAAMFLVGGGIIVHGIPALSEAAHGWAGALSFLADALLGILAGAAVFAVMAAVRKARQ
jgi:hypothetical protein